MKRWTKEEIAYLESNYSCKLDRELARALNRSVKSINYFATKLSLKKDKDFYEKSRKHTTIDFYKDELEKKYFEEKKSMRIIAKEMNVGKTTIEHYFKKYQIKLRSINETRKINPEKYAWAKGLTKLDPRINRIALGVKNAFYEKRINKIQAIEKKYGKPLKEVIYNLYWKEQFSQKQIAKTLKFDRSIIINFMVDFKIPKRPKFQYISSLKGENHPLYGQNWDKFYGKNKSEIKRKEASRRFRELTIKRIQNNEFPFFDTRIERDIAKGLLERGIPFVKQFRINNFVCDFAIPSLKIAIECDGDYWHANPSIYKSKKLTHTQNKKIMQDKKKEDSLNQSGWKLLRFYEKEILSNKSDCLDKIQKVFEEELKEIKSPIDSLMQ